MTRPKVTMGMDHFKSLVDQAKKLKAELISVFGFGEPLMDVGIIDKVRYCTESGLRTFITTNASLLNVDRAFALLKAGLTQIRFSCHGINGNYEKVHQGLKFGEVWRNIANFVFINKVRFDHSCRTSVTVIPMHGETVDDIKAFWGGFVDDLEIWTAHNWGQGREYRKPVRKLKSCGRPFNGPVQIQADGTVIPCCFLTNSEIILGDTYKEPIKDILKGKLFNDLRQAHDTGDLSGLICQKCDQLSIEEVSPLLYSSIDNGINKTSSLKFKLQTEELK